MKKFLYSLLAIATLGLAAGCQREQSVKEEGPTVDVAFNVSLRGIQTKAFSDGLSAKDLYVAVYANRVDGPVYMESLSEADQPGAFADGLTTTVKFRLVRGENYDIAFWAQSPDCDAYQLDKESGTITVDPEGLANDELRDAFYGKWTGTPTSTPQDVTLTRPFAQINVLTTAEDWATLEDSGVDFAGSSMGLSAPTVLNLVSGEAGTPKDYALEFNAIDPDEVNIEGYDGYKYVAMNYVLAGDRATTNVEFSVYRAEDDPLDSFDVPSVPFERNFRTIIRGNIFTVEGEFNVTIDPIYGVIDHPLENNGTADAPYNVEEALEIIDALEEGASTESEVYVAGFITQITQVSTSNGNATYYISDAVAGSNAVLQVYRGKYLDGANFTAQDQIQQGDKVVVCGFLMKYKNQNNGDIIPEFSAGSKIVSLEREATLYQVQFGDMEHGYVSLATPANGFAAGAIVTLSVVPDDNYELDEETLTYNTEGIDDRLPITKDDTGAYSFQMPAGNVTVYARFKEKQNQTGALVDVIDLAFTGVSGTNYASWDGKKGSASDAEYAGNNAGGNSAIQMRSNNNSSGIVSTTSGGSLVKVEVKWNENTSAGRKVDIYGSNTAYASPADLYDTDKQGTKIGSIAFDENTTMVTVPATASYAFVGIRSNSGALYLDEIKITWTPGTLYWIDPITPDNGTLEIDAEDPLMFAEGTPVTVIATPDTNYELSELYYTDENDGHKTDIDKQTLTFDMPAFNVLVYATFTEITSQTTLYSIDPIAPDNGTLEIDADEPWEFAAGTPVTVIATPDTDYELTELFWVDSSVNHEQVQESDKNPIDLKTLTFSMPAQDILVMAVFTEKQNQTDIQSVTVAQFNAAEENVDQKYQLTGVITKITNTTYGNFTLLDATGSVIVYGLTATEQTWDKENKKITNDKSFASLNLKEGDQVTLVGYRIDYNSAPEVAGAYYVSHVADYAPSITASDITGVAAAGVQNATATVTIANLGSGTVNVEHDGTVVTAASWANDVLTYSVAANTGAARQGTITFTITKDNIPMTTVIKVSQLAGTTELGEYDSNVSWAKGSSCYDDNKITVNETANVANLKFGTSSKFGDATITLPSGTTKVTFYAVAWKDTPANLKFTVGSKEYNFDVAACDGAAGNTQPYALTVSASDKKTLTLDAALTEDTTIKVETCPGETNSGKRAFLFGVKAVK